MYTCPICWDHEPLNRLVIIQETNKFICRDCFQDHVSNWLLQPLKYHLTCPITDWRINSNRYIKYVPKFLEIQWNKKQKQLQHVHRVSKIHRIQRCTWDVFFLFSLFHVSKRLLVELSKKTRTTFMKCLKQISYNLLYRLGWNTLLWYGVGKVLDRYVTQQSWKSRETKGLPNIRQCPMCRQKIEKKSGCKHMNCVCGHEFCWECGLSWRRRPLFTKMFCSKCEPTEGPCRNRSFCRFLSCAETAVLCTKIVSFFVIAIRSTGIPNPLKPAFVAVFGK